MKNRKTILIKPLILSMMLLFGGIGAALGANASQAKANAVQATSDSDDGLYTTIVLTDTAGWKFRTLWLDSFTYADGYDQTQRNLFIAGQYVNEFNEWDGTARNGERGRGYKYWEGGVNLATGETSGPCTFQLPAWVTGCTIEVQDDNHIRYLGNINDIAENSGGTTPSETKAGDGVGKTINIECKTDQGLTAGAFVTISNTKNYSDPVTVNRYFLKSDGSVKATDTVTCHKYYYGTVDKVAVDGYATNNKWYVGTTYTAADEYNTSNILTSTDTINLVAKYEVGSNDSTLELRFTRRSDWGDHTVRIHTWNDGGSGTTWPGYAMTYLWDGATSGDTIWSWSPSFDEPLYGAFQFNNDNHGMQSSTLTSPSRSTNYWYDNGWQSGDIEQEVIYLLDYENVYEGNVDVSLSRYGTSFADEVKAVQMIDVATNGLMYKVTFSNRYNRIVFSNNGADKTDYLIPPQTNYVYVLGHDIDTWWDNINYALAYNFAQRTLLMDTIPTSETGTTPECSENWEAAETHYNALMASSYGSYVREQLDSASFADAVERFSEWAKANGKSVNNSTGTISKNNNVLMDADVNNTVLILVIVSISLVTVGGYFLLRRKHR